MIERCSLGFGLGDPLASQPGSIFDLFNHSSFDEVAIGFEQFAKGKLVIPRTPSPEGFVGAGKIRLAVLDDTTQRLK